MEPFVFTPFSWGYGSYMRPCMMPYSRLLRNPGPRQAPQPPPPPACKIPFLIRDYMRPCTRPYSRLLRNPGPRQAPQPHPPPAKFLFSRDQTPMEPLFLQRFQGVRGLHEAMHEAMFPLAAKSWAPPSTTTAPGPPPAEFFFSCDQIPMEPLYSQRFQGGTGAA